MPRSQARNLDTRRKCGQSREDGSSIAMLMRWFPYLMVILWCLSISLIWGLGKGVEITEGAVNQSTGKFEVTLRASSREMGLGPFRYARIEYEPTFRTEIFP